MTQIVFNGAGGNAAQVLLNNNMDPRCLRPYFDDDGQVYIDQVVGNEERAMPVHNAAATLRKNDWILLDTAIIKAAKPRLRAVSLIEGAGLQFTIPNGMSKMTLEHQTQSDINAATISMDGLRRGNNDRPLFDLSGLPLPIIHKDFSFSAREIAASRNGGSPLDTTMAELAARRVAEEAESLLLGTAGAYAYAGRSIYGLTNFPSRLTKSMTAPSTSNQATVVAEILAMKSQSQAVNQYGPWFCFCSTSWDQYMDTDYSSTKGNNTLRDRIGAIEGIDRPTTIDYLPANTLVLVQKTSDVIRMVNGMGLVTVQWESQGGMEINFKVMMIKVPQLRADYNGSTGIVHGSHS